MSNEEAAETQESAQASGPSGAHEPVETQHTPEVEEVEREVTLQRSVRYGRVIVGTAVLGVIVAAVACLFFPIEEGAEYTMGQVAGFAALIGGAIGLGVGGLVALVLGLVARRYRGAGIAVQSDVR